MNAAPTLGGLGRALLAGLGGPELRLVLQGHVPTATAWLPPRSPAWADRPPVVRPSAHASQHRATAQAGVRDAGFAGGQP